MITLTVANPAAGDVPASMPANPVIGVRTRGGLPWAKISGGAALFAAVAFGLGAYWHATAGFETTDDAFLESNVHPVSARISGTVLHVLVDDNAQVAAGQPLAEIDPTDLNLTLQTTEAEVAQARASETLVAAQIARAEANVRAADARIAESVAQLKRAERDFHRAEFLVRDETGAISRQAFDAARAAFEIAQATHRAAIAGQASAEAGLAAAKAQRAVVSAQIQKADAALRAAQLQLDYTIIRAPSAGRVAKKTVQAGQRLQPGQPVMSVVGSQTWVIANFKESQLRHLRVGEKVAVKIDAIEGHIFSGILESFSPGTGARFSLLPPDNSSGNFTRIVQRVPVKIVLDPISSDAAAPRLAPGLSAFVQVSVRE